jgi:hypothetical protein
MDRDPAVSLLAVFMLAVKPFTFEPLSRAKPRAATNFAFLAA